MYILLSKLRIYKDSGTCKILVDAKGSRNKVFFVDSPIWP